MAQHKSAEKQARQSVRKNLSNRSNMSRVKTAVKKFQQLVAQNASKEELMKSFSNAQSFIMRAAKKGVIHKNNASRHVARLSKHLVKTA